MPLGSSNLSLLQTIIVNYGSVNYCHFPMLSRLVLINYHLSLEENIFVDYASGK